jgi:hypothetical protein
MSDVQANKRSVVRRTDEQVRVECLIPEAVAEATDTPVSALGVELNDYIDPDALNDLFAPKLNGDRRGGGRVTFALGGCEVVVHADGRVVATPLDDE